MQSCPSHARRQKAAVPGAQVAVQIAVEGENDEEAAGGNDGDGMDPEEKPMSEAHVWC